MVKAKTQAMLRAEAEEKRVAEVMAKAEAEAEAAQRSKDIYADIWRAFSQNRTKGKSFAYKNLLEDLTKFSSELVPIMMSAKEHFQLIQEAESEIKGEGSSSKEEPMEIVAAWLRGEKDLSKIPLDKLQ